MRWSFGAVLVAVALNAPVPPEDGWTHTFSIAAFDPETGDFGVAVCTLPIRVGAIVPWARAGVGAIATQALANAGFGPRGLEMLEQGRSAQETIDALLTDDADREQRQIGIVDAQGRAAAFTGSRCMDWCGQITGDHYTIQGNILVSRATVEAMERAYTTLRDDRGRAIPFPERILRTIEAGYEAGGDRRGHRSAAILVVRRNVWDQEGYDRLVDVRVDDHDNPPAELRRIVYRRDTAEFALGDRVVERPRGNDIRQAADILGRLGYLQGEPTDLFTDAFGDALARFKRDFGLESGERIDASTTAALRQARRGGMPLRAGAARVAITPTLDGGEVWLAGFDPNRRATAVHDDLWACALVLQVGRDALALVSLDLIGFLQRDVRRARAEIARRVGIPPERVLVASSHTHSGPDTIGLWGPLPLVSGQNPEYNARVVAAIADAVAQARDAMKPATVRVADVEAPEFVRDSREPEVLDPTARILRVESSDGVVATVVNYACHPEVLNGRSTAITADYPHFLRVALEEAAPGSTAMYFSADLGGMQSPLRRGESSFEECERIGRGLAGRVLEALDGAPAVEVRSIEVARQELVFPLDNRVFRAGMLGGMFGDAADVIERDGDDVRLHSETILARLGPVSILTAPGEVFPELGRDLIGMMPGDHRFFLGLGNDELGYIMPQSEWRDGQYEESMSLGPRTGEILREAVRRLTQPEF